MLKAVSRPRAGDAGARFLASLIPLFIAIGGCSSGHAPAPTTSDRRSDPLAGNDVVTLAPSRDTSIRVDAPNQNFGRDPDLEVNRTLVGFDSNALTGALGPQDFLISASLRLTVVDNNLRARALPRVAGVFRLKKDWTEDGATWNCAVDAHTTNFKANCSGSTRWSMDLDPPNPWVAPATDTARVGARQLGVLDFDVTSDVRGFLSGAFENDGWMVRGGTPGEFAEFGSRESAAPPELVLNVRRCSPALCDDGNACTTDACDATGSCTHTAAAEGTSCNDGNACTQTDVCQAGACVGTLPVSCVASDTCHTAGVCDPSTGVCSNPNAADGTTCNDGNACTQTDVCQSGTCTGAEPVVCADGDACHAAGVCDPATGACSNTPLADGTPCDDHNGCTLGDSCLAGACTSGPPRTCPSGGDACHPGSCDPATGACSSPLACQLVGVGSVPASAVDGLDVTPATLPDGISNNQIGGFGSAIAYTGSGNLYLVTPDRGPDNGAVGYTTRFYQIEISVAGGVLTTQFRGGATLKKPSGEPFLGVDSAFDATNSPESRRFDPEGVRVSPAGTFFVSDEYGPFLYEFDAGGTRLRSLTVPPKFLISTPGIEDGELPPTNRSGRLANRGMEGLAITPDGSKLYGIMQSPLIQDGALTGSNKRQGTNVRILEVDTATNATREFLYTLEDKDYGISEILAVNDHQFLVDERDGNGGKDAKVKRLFLIDIAGATDIGAIDSLPSTGIPANVRAVAKMPFLDLLLPDYRLAGPNFPEKIEGIAFGPDQPDGSHLLIVTQDNDFLTGQPSQMFAFAIAPSALPAWQSQGASFSQACVSPAPVTCPAGGDPCRRDGMCNPGNGSCTPPALPAGTAVSAQTTGDCLRNQCDGAGAVVAVSDDGDAPGDDNNACTQEVCSNGVASHPPAQAGTMCNQSGGTLCDGAGACVACLAATDCPGVDNDCAVRTCVAGGCGIAFAAAGAPVAAQTAADCQRNQCDGAGGVVAITDDSDVGDDGNPCTTDVCSAGIASHPFAPAGAGCGGINVCDGQGACVGCVAATDCPGVDNECGIRTCISGVCGRSLAPDATRISFQIAGDCQVNVCDATGSIVQVADPTDVPTDNNDCTIDACTNGVPSNANVPMSTPCNQGTGNMCDGSGRCVTAFMVLRLGSPGGATLNSAAAPVFVDELTTSGTLLRSIALPTALNGSQHRLVNSGQASSEGALALSGDGHFLTLAGYDAAPGTTGIASTPSASTNRVVARIDAAGNVDTSTALSAAFTGNNVRGAVTDDGTRFWVSGANGNNAGVQFVTMGTVTPITSNLTNVRCLEIFNGQLYGSASSGTFTNVFKVGTNLPTASDVAALQPGLPTSAASPFAFVFIGPNTLYVADDRAATAGGGIQKWTQSNGTWSLATTFTAGLGGVGVRGLAGFASGSSVVLVATTAESANPSGQHVVTLVDTGTGTATATNVVTGSNTVAYRGVALPPN